MNLNRSLKHAMVQSEQILSSRDHERVADYGKYVSELKAFILKNSTNNMVLERAEKLPEIKSPELNSIFLTILIMGNLRRLYLAYKYQKVFEQIREAQSIFSSMEFLTRNN